MLSIQSRQFAFVRNGTVSRCAMPLVERRRQLHTRGYLSRINRAKPAYAYERVFASTSERRPLRQNRGKARQQVAAVR